MRPGGHHERSIEDMSGALRRSVASRGKRGEPGAGMAGTLGGTVGVWRRHQVEGASIGHLIEAANMVSATDSLGPVLTILKRKQV